MSDNIPQDDVTANDYKSRTGQSEIPVLGDEKPVEDPIDPDTANNDEELGEYHRTTYLEHELISRSAKDDNEAIDEGNIIGGRTRGAKPSGGYTEPGDEEGLAGPDDGTSAVAGGRT